MAEDLYVWVRRVYRVKDPSRQDPVKMVRAYDDAGLVGSWPEGGVVPAIIWQRYLDENPDVKEVAEKEKRHKLCHDPLRISLR